jgi:protocatechuate 3,4-dioxygenase beta subunit
LTRLLALVFFFLGALSFASLPASAQTPASPAHASSIAGIVVKQPGSQPLKKAVVQVISENQPTGGSYTASSDADGHFQIEDVQPGRYRIFIEKAGFVGVNDRGLKSESNVFTIRPGQSINDLLFQMLPTAVISGRITDEDGDPMAQVRVFALRKKPGKSKRESAGTVATNDLGEYRLGGLFPGQYWIVAMPPPDFRDYEKPREKSSSQENPGSNQSSNQTDIHGDQPDVRYLTTYYPGTYDVMQASSLALKSGDEMPVNLTLVPARTYRVRGTVTGITTGQRPVVELVSKAGDSFHADEMGSDGQFEVRGVGPGSYTLIASTNAATGSGSQSGPSLVARQDINVIAADIDGVKLVPLPAFTLSGHLRVEGASSGNIKPYDLTQYVVNLRLAELPEDPGFFMSPDFFGANATVDRLGNFELKDVNPARYIVQVFGGNAQDNFFLKSARLGERDIETGFTASGPATLDLLISAKGGAIEGTVVSSQSSGQAETETNKHDASHPLAANATVVAVPEEKYRTLAGRFGTGSTDQHGHFTIRGLAPGTYTLFAWQDLEDGIWRESDFLKSQEANGTTVKIEEGSAQKIELKLSPVTEDWR